MSVIQTRARNATNAARIFKQDLRDFVRARREPTAPQLDERQQRLVGDLRRDGFAVVKEYWDRERAMALRDHLEAELADGHNKDYESGAYLRFWDKRPHDQGVRRLYHVDREFPELDEFRNDLFVFDIAAAYYGIEMHSGVLVFQHNTQTNENTRFYHVDAFEREFKSFLYLDDVDEGNGPFSYVRGSQKKHLLRYRKQVVGGSATGFTQDEVGHLLSNEVQVCGPAGTLILANVRGLHRGTPQIDRSRSVLVNYILNHPYEIEPDR